MIIFLLSLHILFNPLTSFAAKSDIFFENVEKMKSIDKKLELLEKRLDFQYRNNVDLQLEKTFNTYLETSGNIDRKIKFILALNQETSKFQPRLQKAFITKCSKAECLKIFPSFIHENKVKLDTQEQEQITDHLSDRNLKVIIDHPEIIKNYVQFLDGYIDQSYETLLFRLLLVGLYDNAQKMFEKYQTVWTTKKWQTLDHCRFLILTGKHKNARNCLNKYKSETMFALQLIYLDYLTGEKKDRPEIEKRYESLVSKFTNETPNFMQAKAVEIGTLILKKNITFANFNIMKLADSHFYRLGLIVLSQDRKSPFLNSNNRQKLTEKYHEQFAGTLFSDALLNKVNKDLIIKQLGAFSAVSKSLE